MATTYTTPSGTTSALYEHITKQTHVLIAGTTGSGKSVTVRGILNNLLFCPFCDVPGSAEMILIDPKGTELTAFSYAPHCIKYASAAREGEMIAALRTASAIVDKRFSAMQADPSLMDEKHYYRGSDLWVVIDELADLVLTPDAAEVKRIIQHIGQIGRAARVHLLACTQCPIVKVIPTEIKVNFDAVLALRTRSAQDSRNIIGIKGAELFPKHGKALYQNPDDSEIVTVDIPYQDEVETRRLVDHWRAQLSPSVNRRADKAKELPSNRTESPNSALNGFSDNLLGKIGNVLKWACRLSVGAYALSQIAAML